MALMALLPTFAQWIGLHGLPDDPGLSEDTRVTIAWLQYDQAIDARVQEMRDDPVGGSNTRVLFDALSEDIIDSHLGHGWYEEHVERSASSARTQKYLDFGGPPAARLLAAQRVHELARRLYQLQSFDWFDDVIRRVRTRDLSGAGFELDVVFLLHSLVSAVTPKEESGQKGDDYDIQLRVYGLHYGLDVPVEVKAKDDDTPYSENTVLKTIKSAAQQLPKGSKGIVFLRVPTAWIGTDLQPVLAEATRQTSRIGAVVTATDHMILNEEKTKGHVTRHYGYFRHKDCPEDLWDACLNLKETLERELDYFLAPSPPF